MKSSSGVCRLPACLGHFSSLKRVLAILNDILIYLIYFAFSAVSAASVSIYEEVCHLIRMKAMKL